MASFRKKKLLVLGGRGLLGSELLDGDYLQNWEIMIHGRSVGLSGMADLTLFDETARMLDALAPDTILNLVGLTNVDHCEQFPNDAYLGNVKTVENVVAWIKNTANKTVRLVHISTDQVYDGSGPHKENDVSLKNYYAFSKYAGELNAVSVNSVILRTNFFGKSKCPRRDSLTDWLFSALLRRDAIRVFDDVMFSPLSMNTLCELISLVLESQLTGIYNLGSRGGLSKADFSFVFANTLALDVQTMTRCTTADVDFLKTYRPKDMRLDVSRFECATGIQLPFLSQEIERAAEEYRK